MVYCGPPSKGCGRCRSMKVRCDRETPQCGRCVRARVDCPGYRDYVSLLFKDQNESLSAKANQRHDERRRETQRRSGQATPLLASDQSGAPASTSTALIRVGRPETQRLAVTSLHDQASCFFFSNFTPYNLKHAQGDMSYLRTLASDPAVKAGIQAVGLAALANIRHDPSIMAKARQEYSTALTRTNAALRSEALSKKDSTLAVVILFGLYENVTFDEPNTSFKHWKQHVKGAERLLELRGRSQASHPEGIKMLTQARLMIAFASRGEEYMPHWFESWAEETQKHRVPTDPLLYNDRLCALVPRWIKFNIAVRDGLFPSPAATIAAALELDAEFVAWAASAPPYHEVVLNESKMYEPYCGIYDRTYHVYAMPKMGNAYNNYRSARIRILETMENTILQAKRSDISYSDHQVDLLTAHARSTIRQMCLDMAASVPHHFEGGSLCSAHGALLLLYPLNYAAENKYAPQSLRDFASETFEVIARQTGVSQALSLAKALRARFPEARPSGY